MIGYVTFLNERLEGLIAPSDEPCPVHAAHDDAMAYGHAVLRPAWTDIAPVSIKVDLTSDPRIARLLSAAKAIVDADGAGTVGGDWRRVGALREALSAFDD